MLNDALKYQKQNSDPAVWLLPNVFDMSLYPPPLTLFHESTTLLAFQKSAIKNIRASFCREKAFRAEKYTLPARENNISRTQLRHSCMGTGHSLFPTTLFPNGNILFYTPKYTIPEGKRYIPRFTVHLSCAGELYSMTPNASHTRIFYNLQTY